jgi:glycosyltransferase involved in cell wall biosynthesis
LAKLCHVKVVALAEPADLPEREEMAGFELLRPRWRRVPKLGVFVDGYRYAARAARAIAALHGTFDFDLIDAHWLYPDAFAAVRLGRRFHTPVVVTGRGSDVDEFLFRWPVRHLTRAALRRADHLVALTRRHRQKMIEAGAEPDRITVIPNGVDTTLFCLGDRQEARHALGLPPEGILLFSAGAVVEEKGYQHLIAGMASAIPDSRFQVPDVRLFIAGPGEYRGALEQLARDCGVAERVTFLGRVAQSQMPLWYRAADFFCFASYHEGCPNAVLEALACGTPVLSTGVGGIPDLVEEGRSGLLFKPRSDEAFAAALRAALARPWDRAAIAALGSRRSWSHVAAEYLALFNQLIAAKHGAV